MVDPEVGLVSGGDMDPSSLQSGGGEDLEAGLEVGGGEDPEAGLEVGGDEDHSSLQGPQESPALVETLNQGPNFDVDAAVASDDLDGTIENGGGVSFWPDLVARNKLKA